MINSEAQEDDLWKYFKDLSATAQKGDESVHGE